MIDCFPSVIESKPLLFADGRYAPVFPGWGHYHYRISTVSDSAQYYFDQGLSLFYGYHLIESLASFREAAAKDSNCAMAYWGQALAMGPYYNRTFNYKMPPEVLPVIERMNVLVGEGPEKDLILAMSKRFSADTTDSHRAALNSDYSGAMKLLMKKYPDDPDMKALYIDGVMTEHAWDLWDTKGNPKPWTPELIGYCTEILAIHPYHPAALHYHIHLLEASLHPELTLPSADKLKAVAPGIPHMVHMASHTYQRAGLFAKGVAVNEDASAAQKQYDSLAAPLHLGPILVHYYAVEALCALNAGMYTKAKQTAAVCQQTLATNRAIGQRTNLQYLYMMPLFTRVRFGKWNEILGQPGPDRRWVYASLLNDWGRGIAYLRTGNLSAARQCLDSLQDKLKDPALKVVSRPFNPAIEGASVAEGILEGEILFAENKSSAAMAAFNRAAEREDGMSYQEPKDWLLPARQFAGRHLLRLKRAADAEKLYREDLVSNPGNGWAFLGLARSLDLQHKKGAAEFRARAKVAFADAEEKPTGSVY